MKSLFLNRAMYYPETQQKQCRFKKLPTEELKLKSKNTLFTLECSKIT